MNDEKHIIKTLKDNGYTFLCKLGIKGVDLGSLCPKKRTIPPDFLKFLEDSIKLLPLYAGGMDDNGDYGIIIGFKNGNIKANWINENCRDVLWLKKEDDKKDD